MNAKTKGYILGAVAAATYGMNPLFALPLYDALHARGATMIGSWPNEGYEFSASSALEGDRFVGLVLDQDNQFDETDARLATWLEEIKPHLL